jgi:hypothetical protein
MNEGLGTAALNFSVNVTTALPEAPLKVTAGIEESYIFLSWTPPASTGGSPILAYNIYCGHTSGKENYLASEVILSF